MDLCLTGKCALVTGGSMGIGKAAALALAAGGCRVAIAARSKQALALDCLLTRSPEVGKQRPRPESRQ
jgi:NAD(P)-dependent dehydrogenase (short-subunit alcohol dehydrogenase family)